MNGNTTINCKSSNLAAKKGMMLWWLREMMATIMALYIHAGGCR